MNYGCDKIIKIMVRDIKIMVRDMRDYKKKEKKLRIK